MGGCGVILALVGSVLLFRAPDSCAYLGQLDEFPPGSVTRIDCVPAFVVVLPGDTQPTVFLAQTPHLEREILSWDPDSSTFYAPTHGERFDIRGEILDGPASRPLWKCPTEVRGGRQVWIRGGEHATRDELWSICKGNG